MIICGNLFDIKRLVEIVKMNLGFYDHLAVDDFTPPKLDIITPDVIQEEEPPDIQGLLHPL